MYNFSFTNKNNEENEKMTCLFHYIVLHTCILIQGWITLVCVLSYVRWLIIMISIG